MLWSLVFCWNLVLLLAVVVLQSCSSCDSTGNANFFSLSQRLPARTFSIVAAADR
jgi:hypothetical protein